MVRREIGLYHVGGAESFGLRRPPVWTSQPGQQPGGGKKKDHLQDVISLLKNQDFGIALQFTNYR